MSQTEIMEIENSLREAKLMEIDDSLIITEKGDYWEKFFILRNQVRGYYYFTNKRIIFIGGFAGTTQWFIPYKNINGLKKCSVGLFIPCGINVIFFDEVNNKEKVYKMSVLKREKWINFINERRKSR